jgi:hypothetical protein
MACDPTILPAAVFHAGPSRNMNWFTTAGDGGRRAGGTRPGGDQMNGAGKILCLGGGPAYEGEPATNAASVVTLDGNTASARAIGGMAFARAFAMSVVLPDGKVVTIGGMPMPRPFFDTDAVLEPGARSNLDNGARISRRPLSCSGSRIAHARCTNSVTLCSVSYFVC